jgi:hypothetical protein
MASGQSWNDEPT